MNNIRGRIRTIRKVAAMVVMVAAGLAMLAADALDDVELFRLAVTAWLIAVTTYVTPRTGVTARIVDLARQGGYESGYDAGYDDGHEIGQREGRNFPLPVLLRPSAGSAGPRGAFPLDSAAQ